MTTNIYTYEVHTNEALHFPLHIVDYTTPLCCGCAVFSNAKDARAFILELKADFPIEYDFDRTIPSSILDAYKNARSLFSKIENRQLYIAY